MRFAEFRAQKKRVNTLSEPNPSDKPDSPNIWARAKRLSWSPGFTAWATWTVLIVALWGSANLIQQVHRPDQKAIFQVMAEEVRDEAPTSEAVPTKAELGIFGSLWSPKSESEPELKLDPPPSALPQRKPAGHSKSLQKSSGLTRGGRDLATDGQLRDLSEALTDETPPLQIEPVSMEEIDALKSSPN